MADEIIIENPDELTPPRSGDFFLTIFLLFLLLVMTVVFVISGVGMSVTSIGCGDSGGQCNSAVLSAGTLLALGGPVVVALATVITTVVFIARRHRSFLVPLIGCLVSVGLFALGSWLVGLAVPAG